MSAVDLARAAEISKGYLSEIETGRALRPSGAVLYRLATALGTSIADLLEKEPRPASRSIPLSLRTFAERANITEEDIQMLAQIRFRGAQPNTPEDWSYLYESIQRSISRERGGSNS
ncbi:MAG: helix-turn-helix transcriptional regulator [Chloroflexota bacterium]|nr:helix-turn-helix transcriptional regulator [Chloroflexota bacterium]